MDGVVARLSAIVKDDATFGFSLEDQNVCLDIDKMAAMKKETVITIPKPLYRESKVWTWTEGRVRVYHTSIKVAKELEDRGVHPRVRQKGTKDIPQADIEEVHHAQKQNQQLIRPRNPLEVIAIKLIFKGVSRVIITCNCGEQIEGECHYVDYEKMSIFGRFFSKKEFPDQPCRIIAFEDYNQLRSQIHAIYATVLAELVLSYMRPQELGKFDYYDWNYSGAPAKPACLQFIAPLQIFWDKEICESEKRAKRS